MAVTAVLLVALAGAGVWFGVFRTPADTTSDRPLTPPLTRGPLRVTVMEAGNLDSLQSQKIINTVEGRNAIDYVVDEGTILTAEDVRKGTVLVRINSAAVEEKRVRQEIEVSAASDGHANAVTNLEIQIQQNASDLRKADLDVRFALLDLERYVGKTFAVQLLKAYGPAVSAPQEGEAGGIQGGLDAGTLRRLIATLLDSDALEGEALQKIRQFKSDIQLADEEHRRAEEKVRHSIRLEEKGYVSRENLEADKLALERRVIEKLRTNTARDQFVGYDFPKEVEKLISGVVEARDRRSRVAKKADAGEVQKRSAVVSRLRQWELKKKRLESYIEQEKACVLRATVPGLVVYASSQSGHWRGSDERIHKGANVRQAQTLITIPDPSSLGVIIKVHETAIKKVRVGQDAWVEVDAAPGERFPARVTKVARMPDSADRWMNPDLKVYTTELRLVENNAALKPGMSAQVEIHVTTLDDVLSVPVQAVAGTAEQPAVYVWKAGEVTRREVVLGMTSEHFVEIASGLDVGERVVLDPPREQRSTGPKRPEGGEHGADGKGRSKRGAARRGANVPGRDGRPSTSPGAGKGRRQGHRKGSRGAVEKKAEEKAGKKAEQKTGKNATGPDRVDER